MNKRQAKKQLTREAYPKTKETINLLFKTLKELKLTPYNIDFSGSHSPWKYSPTREQIIFKIKEISHIVFGLWVADFQVGSYPSHRNRAIFGEFDFAVDKFRPSSVSWSPGHGFIEQGEWVSDEDFISQIRQIKVFVEEPWKLADGSWHTYSKKDYLFLLELKKKKEKEKEIVLNFANDHLTRYMQDNGIALALVEKETNNFLWSKYYTSFNLYFNVNEGLTNTLEHIFDVGFRIEEAIDKFIREKDMDIPSIYFDFNVKDVFLYSNDSEKFPTDFSRKGLEAFFEAELKGSISTIKNLAEE